MHSMFQGCAKLAKIEVSKYFTLPELDVVSGEQDRFGGYMFYNCTSLKGGMNSSFSDLYSDNTSYAYDATFHAMLYLIITLNKWIDLEGV
jgi:hypothetical protein